MGLADALDGLLGTLLMGLRLFKGVPGFLFLCPGLLDASFKTWGPASKTWTLKIGLLLLVMPGYLPCGLLQCLLSLTGLAGQDQTGSLDNFGLNVKQVR